MAPAQLASLFGRRRRLDRDALAAGTAAWDAYAGPDPAAVARLLHGERALPFVADAARCHLERLPAARDGLNELERALLAALARTPLAFSALFERATATEAVRRLGAGNVQVAGTALAGRRPRDVPAPRLALGRCRRAPRRGFTPRGMVVRGGWSS